MTHVIFFFFALYYYFFKCYDIFNIYLAANNCLQDIVE